MRIESFTRALDELFDAIRAEAKEAALALGISESGMRRAVELESDYLVRNFTYDKNAYGNLVYEALHDGDCRDCGNPAFARAICVEAVAFLLRVAPTPVCDELQFIDPYLDALRFWLPKAGPMTSARELRAFARVQAAEQRILEAERELDERARLLRELAA